MQHDKTANRVQVMPLNEDEVLSIQEIYGEMMLQEDRTAMRKTRKEDEPTGIKTLSCTADIFRDVKELKRVFVTGEAGYGKTVLSLKLSKVWANEKRTNLSTDKQPQSPPSQNTEDEAMLCQYLSVYDLVFHVSLRHVEGSSVVDLVCDSVPECDQNDKEKIKLMLGDRNIPCMIILDGLDECKLSSVSRIRGFLERGLVNTVVLCTMRPWRMLDLELGLDRDHDKVVQISGLKKESVREVFSKILLNFYDSKKTPDLHKSVNEKFTECRQLPVINTLVTIPLILILLCHVLYEECKDDAARQGVGVDEGVHCDASDSGKISHFTTCLYLKLLKMTITRTEKKNDDVREYLDRKQTDPPTMQNQPKILSYFGRIIDFFEVIEPVGKLFFECLAKETHLDYPKDDIKRNMGGDNVKRALKAGIFSIKSPCSPHEERVSVNFHKSIQEFVAALYIACGGQTAFISFCEQCSTVDQVMELSNMVTFVFGLDPVVGCRLSEHVNDVVNNDADIMQYREQGKEVDAGNKKVKVLYKLQCIWYSEMKQNRSYTRNTGSAPPFHVTDVYLDMFRDRDHFHVTSELVSIEENSIVSVYLNCGWYPVHCIIQHLPDCKHLASLYIFISDTQDRKLLAEVLPRMEQLQYVEYGHNLYNSEEYDIEDAAVVHATVQLRALECMGLHGFNLTDAVILPQLQKLKLYNVFHAHYILAILPEYPNLTSLHIEALDTKKCGEKGDCKSLAKVLPQLQHLQFIHYNGENSKCRAADHAAVVNALQHFKELTHIELSDIYLGDESTLITPHIAKLQLKLDNVQMSTRRWAELVFSLLNVQHTVNVILELRENVEVRLLLHNSPHFTVIEEERDCLNKVRIEFHTEQQQTHIKLSNIDLSNLGDYCTLLPSDMSQLQTVELVRVCMSDRRWREFINSLQHATQLTHIKLSNINLHSMNMGDHVTHLVTPRMTQLQKLTHIELGYINLGVDGTLLVTLHMAQIQKVELEEVWMSSGRWSEFFSSLQHATQLTHIKLTGIDLSNLGDDVTLLSPRMTQLQKVELICVKMSPNRWSEFFSSLQHATQLTHIKLTGIDLSNLGDDVTLPSPLMAQLQKLELINVEMSPRRWSTFFSSLQHATELTHITLSVKDMYFMDLCRLNVDYGNTLQLSRKKWPEFFSSLQHVTRLTHIELSGINLGDDSTLLVTPQMTRLQKVKLKGVTMSLRRWKEFFSSLQHATQRIHVKLSRIYLVTNDDDDGTDRGWGEFVDSLLNVQHRVHVTLWKRNIDGDTLNTIQTKFTVTKEVRHHWGDWIDKIKFHNAQ